MMEQDSKLFNDKANTVQVRADGASPVVFTPEDFDRFVLTQKQTVRAARAMVDADEQERQTTKLIGQFVAGLELWCKKHNIKSCIVSPRMDDLMVVVIAKDEDETGALHDQLSHFDLLNFNENKLRISWILLRSSESEGSSAFVDSELARTLYHAN